MPAERHFDHRDAVKKQPIRKVHSGRSNDALAVAAPFSHAAITSSH
jgi:hypothetical protein